MFYRSYIFKNHNGIYYFRYIIPKRFRDTLPNIGREIRKSLKTKSRTESLSKSIRYKVFVEDFITQLESMDYSIEELEQGFALLKRLDDLKLQIQSAPYLSDNLDDFIRGLTSHEQSLIEKSQDQYNKLKKKNGAVSPHIVRHEQQVPLEEDRVSVTSLIDRYLGERTKNTTPKTIEGYKTHLNILR